MAASGAALPHARGVWAAPSWAGRRFSGDSVAYRALRARALRAAAADARAVAAALVERLVLLVLGERVDDLRLGRPAVPGTQVVRRVGGQPTLSAPARPPEASLSVQVIAESSVSAGHVLRARSLVVVTDCWTVRATYLPKRSRCATLTISSPW